MKRVLIISPHFAPINAADMHRVRLSLPYFQEFGWDPIVLAVDPAFVEMKRDDGLMETVPTGADVRYIGALDYHATRRVGLGSLALRSMWSYRKAGDAILAVGDVDLVYFSTTAFPVLILGPRWKRKFDVPFVVDMQDPWRSDHYLTLPPGERPPKFWFSYRLDKALEPRALPHADGIVSVTQAYIDLLTTRYPSLDRKTTTVIPFGASERDAEAAGRLLLAQAEVVARDPGEIRGVYTGVVNSEMVPVLEALFAVLRKGLETAPERFEPVRLHFVGTSYAPEASSHPVVLPIAAAHGVADRVTEQVGRIPYLAALRWQQEADFLLLPGTLDPDYVASKLYPYVFARRPILAPFHARSQLVPALAETNVGEAISFDPVPDEDFAERLLGHWARLLEALPGEPPTDWDAVEPYTAREMTRRQAEFFDQTLARIRR